MNKQFIYANNIVLPKSVIGLLDGSEQFCFENPYFQVPGIKPVDKKLFLEPRQSKKPKSSNDYGTMLNSPYIYVKSNSSSNVFTTNYAIGYTENRGSTKIKKEYYIMKPFQTSNLSETSKIKLMVRPRPSSTGEILIEDKILIQLDYQFSMLMDVLIIAKVLNIDLAEFKGQTNENFYPNFVKRINAFLTKIGENDKIINTEDAAFATFVESFETPPVLLKTKKEISPVEIVNNGKKTQRTFKQLFARFMAALEDHDDILSKWDYLRTPMYAGAVPTFKYAAYLSKKNPQEPKYEETVDVRLIFNYQLDPTDKGYNEKIPDFVITRQQVNKREQRRLTKHAVPSLWGGSPTDDNESTRKGMGQSGCLYIIPQPSFKYYQQAGPTVEWRVEKTILTPVATANSVEYDEGNELMDEDIDDINDTLAALDNIKQSNSDSGNEPDLPPGEL